MAFCNGKKNFQKVILWLPIILYRLYFWLITEVKVFPDSNAYIGYPFSSLIQGQLNGRTPIYPLVIRIFLKLFGEIQYLEAITIFQSLISFIAVVYYFRICKLFSINQFYTTILLYLYGWNTSVIGWDRDILTESLALSLLVITFFYTFDFIKNLSIKSAVIAQFIVFVMVFERPSSIIYWMMINVFFVVFGLTNKIPRIKLPNIMFAVTSIIILIYMSVFNFQFGVFSLTDAVPRQHLIVVMEKGYYKSSSNKAFIDKVESSMKAYPNDIWLVTYAVLNEYGNKRVTQLTNECYRKNLKAFIFDRVHQIHEDSDDDYISEYIQYKDFTNNINSKAMVYFNSLFRINVKHTLLMLMILSVLLFKEILNRKIKWISLGLFGSMLGTFYVSYYGTCAEYPRTMLGVVPISFIALVYILNQCNSLNGEKDCLSFGRRK